MNAVFFTGHVGKDAEVRTVNGTDVCNFNVAVKQGFSRDAPTEWYRVAVWGQRGSSIAQYIKKGGKVAVAGELEIGSYEGKPQFNVRAHEVDPFMSRREDEGGGAGGQRAQQPAPAYAEELEDDVPFLRADGIF